MSRSAKTKLSGALVPEREAFAPAPGSALFTVEYRWAHKQGRSVAAGGSAEQAAREFRRAHPHVEVVRCY